MFLKIFLLFVKISLIGTVSCIQNENPYRLNFIKQEQKQSHQNEVLYSNNSPSDYSQNIKNENSIYNRIYQTNNGQQYEGRITNLNNQDEFNRQTYYPTNYISSTSSQLQQLNNPYYQQQNNQQQPQNGLNYQLSPNHQHNQFTNFLPQNFIQNIFSSLNPMNLNLGGQFNEALYNVVKNDDYQCVPRLLCQVLADSDYRDDIPEFLTSPTIGTLISALPGATPFLVFAKAAILGFTGGRHNCYNAYTKCPRNEDDLLYYLNNHKGGFFKLFKGGQTYNDVKHEHYNNQNNYAQNQPSSSTSYAESLFTRLSSLIPARSKNIIDMIIPKNSFKQFIENLFGGLVSSQIRKYRGTSAQSYYNADDTNKNRHIESRILNKNLNAENHALFKFPNNEKFQHESLQNYPKLLKFEDKDTFRQQYQSNKHYSEIFPDRTGTGNLRFDNDRFYSHSNSNYQKPNNNLQFNYSQNKQYVGNSYPYYSKDYSIREQPGKKQTDPNVYVTDSKGKVVYYINPNGVKVYI